MSSAWEPPFTMRKEGLVSQRCGDNSFMELCEASIPLSTRDPDSTLAWKIGQQLHV